MLQGVSTDNDEKPKSNKPVVVVSRREPLPVAISITVSVPSIAASAVSVAVSSVLSVPAKWILHYIIVLIK